jgi:hypothetical protein
MYIVYQYCMGSRPVFVNYKKAALDSQPQMLKLTNFLPIVGGSLKGLQLTVREYLLQTATNVSCLSETISGPFFIYDLLHKC